MTMPSERTHALLMAGELLREIQTLPTLPDELRQQATVVLRHYPSALDIGRLAKQCEQSGAMMPLLESE